MSAAEKFQIPTFGERRLAHGAWVKNEDRIIWVRDPASVRWARMRQQWITSRAREPSWYNGDGLILMGYATIKPNVPSPILMRGRFLRRVFYVGRDDFTNERYNPVGAPDNAVDLLTVAAGIIGEMTPRAWYAAAHAPSEPSNDEFTLTPPEGTV